MRRHGRGGRPIEEEYDILTARRTGAIRIGGVEDDFWTEHLPFYTAQFPAYYTKPQKVWGRLHASDEPYFAGSHEIIPLKEKNGMRTYVMMQPYVLEPQLMLTVGLYKKPKHYADQDSAVG